MSISRLAMGLVFLIAGIALTVVCFLTTFFLLIYAIPLLIIGFFILFNKREDIIEKRKDLKEKKYTK